MKKEMVSFVSEKFGRVRMVEVNGRPYAVAKDVATALGYKNTNDAINKHCKGVVKHDTLTNGGKQEMNIIPEGDIIRLAVKCPLDGADEFESWIFDEVMPSVLQNGGYISENATVEQVKELIRTYSFKSITQQINECDILELPQLVESIFQLNSSAKKKDRDEYHKGMNKTEYKQHLREHIRKAVINRSYNDKGVDSAIETAIRYKIIE